MMLFPEFSLALAAMAGISAPAHRHVTIADSIYALAVDSNAYKEFPFVYLLDEGVVRIEADGKGTRTYRQVVQILKPAGVDRWAEQSVSYQPDREKVTVNWMRVVRPSGEVISDKPTQSQSSDVPASITNPVYTETKVLRYSLGNVTPGTLVDISWTIETTNPPLTGDMLNSWSVSLATPGMRSRFVLDVPSALTPHIVETHLDFKRSESTVNGRHVFTWAAQNIKPPKSEMFAPDSSVPAMSIRVGTPLTWTEIGRWYNGLSKDRYTLTPALVAEVDSIVRRAKTAGDTLNALHRWIARDLRYVSVSLGLGGYQPRLPEATVTTGYGDCKDKATLFIAAARHFGIVAYPVLLNSFGGSDKDLPAVEQFNHVIAAVQRRGQPGFSYLDLTTYDFPNGEIPPSYQGGFGLLVMPDGSSKDVTFPKDSAARIEQRFVGELTADGKVSGTFTYAELGSAEANFRASFAEGPDSAERAEMRRTAPKVFPGSTLDTVILFDPKDMAHRPEIQYVERGGDGAKPAGQLSILTIPPMFRGAGAGANGVAEELQRADARRLPIEAAQIMGSGNTRQEIRLTLPDGWKAQLPDSVAAVSPFGEYRVNYSQVGRELRIVHTIVRGSGVYPASSVGGLIDWLKMLAKDDAEFVALSRGS